MTKSLVIGSVAYDPRVVTIWEGIRDYFRSQPVQIDFVLFSNYEAQVEALFAGSIDIAWNTNLAFVTVDRRLQGGSRILAMRDTDVEFTSKVVVPATSSVKQLADLKGKKIAFGSRDSAQACIMPEHYLRLQGLRPDIEYEAIRFNTDVGKHGDTGTSENDVLEAVRSGKADAGALGESTWLTLAASGASADLRLLWTSPPYSHCVFTALPDLDENLAKQFVDSLLAMDYNNPLHRPILEMEGLKRWVLADRKGYTPVFDAVESTGYFSSEAPVVAAKH